MKAFVTVGRVLLGLSFALDGVWWLSTWEIRAAYLERAGGPSLLIVPIAVVYLAGGILVAIGRAVRPAVVALIAVAGLITMSVHTDIGPGGIGEYPLDQHGRQNTNALLLQVGLAGTLLLAFAIPRSSAGVDRRAVVLGRILLGVYFVLHGLHLSLYYDAIMEHLAGTGARALLLPITIGVQVVFGMTMAAGRNPRLAALVIGPVLIAWTLLVHAGPAGWTQPLNAQVHQWFVGGALVAGLCFLFALGPASVPPPMPEKPPE